MRKLSAILISAALMCGGCSFFSSSDETSTTATTPEAESSMSASTPEPEPAVKKETPARTAKGKKSEAQIKAELDQMGKKLAAQSARTLVPNKGNKSVKQVGGQWVASYIDVDPNSVTTQMRPGNNGQYVGSIRYAEHFMECTGSTRQAALSATAPCKEVRTRNMNELIRYDGREWQD